MKRIAIAAATLFILAVLAGARDSSPEAKRFWPQWRGPNMTGAAAHGNPPVKWSEDKNVRWKTEVPGKGSATPIIWGDSIFVLTAIPTGKKAEPKEEEEPAPEAAGRRRRRRGPRGIQPTEVLKFVVYAIDRNTGKILWERVAREELPHEGTHPTGTWASHSPVTDGERVYAYFGSRGLYCYSMDGELLWEKDFGNQTIRLGFGEGASPTLYGDKIIVNWDHEGESFIVALNKKTGNELWLTRRDEITSWTTPIVVENKGKAQVITSATTLVRSYDVETGKLLWQTSGMTLNAIPSPVAADGMVFVTSGFRGNALLAIRLDAARGDISDSEAIVWRLDRDTPYAPSPLLYQGALYFLKSNSGILSSYNARTGERNYQERLPGTGTIYASPVGAAGRVYVADRDGTIVVLEHGSEFKVLATNKLDDGFDASPAVVGDDLYLRGHHYLYRISAE